MDMIPITRLLGTVLVAAPFLSLGLIGCAPAKVLCPKDYQVDLMEAQGFAAKAGLAYEADSLIAEACGADSCFILSGGQTGARAFVQRDDSAKVQWIAFRGTASLDDIQLDAKYSQARDTSLRMTFHSGFASGAEDVLPGILPHLNPAYRTLITGHSLGGALAAIAALRLDAQGFKVKAITFGQPKVTNEAGAKRAAHVDLVRFIHGQDIVALVPPVDWRPGKDLGSYAHFGREIALNDQGFECLQEHYAKRFDPSSWWDQAQRKAVEDHSMAKYKARLVELAGTQASTAAPKP